MKADKKEINAIVLDVLLKGHQIIDRSSNATFTYARFPRSLERVENGHSFKNEANSISKKI